MTKASDNLFPKLLADMNTSDPAAPSDRSWKIYPKADGIYARSSNQITGPFTSGYLATSMPTAPATNARVFRTDLGMEFYYDGTRWLTAQLFTAHCAQMSISGTFAGARFGAMNAPGLGLYLVAMDLVVGVYGTNNGSNYWTYTLDKRDASDAATTLITKNTSGNAASTWVRVNDALGVVASLASAFTFIIQASVKTGGPANLQIQGGFTYRLIGT